MEHENYLEGSDGDTLLLYLSQGLIQTYRTIEGLGVLLQEALGRDDYTWLDEHQERQARELFEDMRYTLASATIGAERLANFLHETIDRHTPARADNQTS